MMPSIGKQIAAKRKEKGLSQNSLAQLVGVTRVALAHYEQGFRNPSIATLQKIATALGCRLEIFLR